MLRRKFSNSNTRNEAFLGVKGLGKTTQIKEFVRKNKKEFFAEKNIILVEMPFDGNRIGTKLAETMFEKISYAIMRLDSSLLDICSPQKISDDSFGPKDEDFENKVELLLENIHDEGYRVIMIMDHFHLLQSDKSIQEHQYELLRSFHSNGIIQYLALSDSDFTDADVTEQFATSFFSQTFHRQTFSMMSEELSRELVMNRLTEYDAGDTSEEKLSQTSSYIYQLVSGIPSMLEAAAECVSDLTDRSYEKILDALLKNYTCLSLMDAWTRGLNEQEKQLLLLLAETGSFYEDDGYIYAGDNRLENISTVQITPLADEAGLGLICKHRGCPVKYTLNSELFREYVIMNLRKQEQPVDISAAPPAETVNRTVSQDPSEIFVRFVNTRLRSAEELEQKVSV